MQNQTKKRAAGILLPVFSLPSPYGIGSFGQEAYRWVDFLADAGQTYWQVLPLGPTSYGDSPYQSFSAFAGNPYFIDLTLLQDEGLLTREECESMPWGEQADKVDYNLLFQNREKLLRLAASRHQDKEACQKFRVVHSDWLEDYALYMAIKAKNNLRPWTEWEEDIRLRQPEALKKWGQALQEDVEYHIFVQYLFFKQWSALKEYANKKGVYIIGDIPLYIAMDSADTWADSSLFLLDEQKNPIEVAGVPPDGFSATGQLWGNPLYRWDVMKENGYEWWIRRMRASMTLFDVLRIDHFRGLESYYAIPYGSTTAATGSWKKGPGIDFVHAINNALGDRAHFIAEDLGFLTEGVHALLRDSGYPGMKVLEFAFDSREESDYMPHNYERHCIVYTGTHDNDTVQGWFQNAPAEDVQLARDYLGVKDDADGSAAFIRAALGSVANLAIIPLQDYLGLGSEARINTPSTMGGNNWRWRMEKEALTPERAAHILRLTTIFSR